MMNDLPIHEAGPMLGWVQTCKRCGEILSDYRNAAWPDDQPAPGGFAEGDFIEIDNPIGGPKYSGVTQTQPNCRRRANKGWSAGEA